jgi:hypothetical protein
MIGWYTAHQAVLRGYGRLWAVVFGVVVFFLFALSLNLISWARHRKRQLSANKDDTSLETTEIQRLAGEIGTLKTDLSAAQGKAHALEVDIRGKKQEMKEVQRERDRYKAELTTSQENAGEWQRSYHEVNNAVTPIKNLNENLECQLKESEKQLLGVRAQCTAAQHDAKQGHLRAKDQANQKDEFYELYKKSERRLADWAFLIKHTEDQARAISDFVVITKITPTRFNLDSGDDRVVGVTLQILNNSVFDITINPKNIKGHFHFENKPRKEPVHVPIDADHLPVEKLKPKQAATLYIEQPLRTSEAERINEADDQTSFWLGSLSIPITIENAPPEVTFKQDVDMVIPPILAEIPIFHFLL